MKPLPLPIARPRHIAGEQPKIGGADQRAEAQPQKKPVPAKGPEGDQINHPARQHDERADKQAAHEFLRFHKTGGGLAFALKHVFEQLFEALRRGRGAENGELEPCPVGQFLGPRHSVVDHIVFAEQFL